MDKTAIVKNNPKQKSGLSLKWKWAMGSALGFFLIFIIFSYILIVAFTNRMLVDEKSSTRASLNWVAQSLQKVPIYNLEPQKIESEIVGDNALSQKQEVGLVETMRTDFKITIYDGTNEVYPKHTKQAIQLVDQKIKLEHDARGRRALVGYKKIQNSTGQTIGMIRLVNHLDRFNRLFNRIYLITLVATLLGLFFIAIWGYWLADYLLRPMEDIKKVVDAARIDAQSQTRVDLAGTRNDELTDLGKIVNRSLDQMQRTMLTQHQFVEDVSHELRTPVAIVKGHMDLLNRWGKNDPKILNESIEASLNEINRMQGLVQEMLDLTRADQVELAFKDGNTDTREVVKAVYNNFKMIHDDFTFILDDDLKKPTMVNMSRDHLEQIMIILSDNAVKYSRDRKEIHYSVARSGGQVQIAVQDFGEGISPKEAQHVFDRFYRIDKARSRKQGGNGLGLSIAQKLIEGYGGQLS
ncbi:sensor histidine kinase [Weissella coleopterorum]|uniref:sensor histidine kinase n=1 Tax=Weissella coleopterorum TaxID=2714949 RepID=UPI001FEAF634|nr:ATP-binding protein [Weissella coleopterorum]